jgi:hypothetical protein
MLEIIINPSRKIGNFRLILYVQKCKVRRTGNIISTPRINTMIMHPGLPNRLLAAMNHPKWSDNLCISVKNFNAGRLSL